MIRFDNVSKRYARNITALEQVTFEITAGEFVFLVGSSGAGKTTILKLIDREINPTSGSLFVDGADITKLPSSKVPYLRRKLGYIFQDFKLLFDRTVAENVALALRIRGSSEEEIKHKVPETLSFLGISDRASYFPRQLSLGEQQRVAIGRAVIAGSKIILADEPTGNLDPRTSWEILKIIRSINKMGTTILMATHNVDIVNSMKKRVIVLKKGKIIKDEKKSTYGI